MRNLGQQINIVGANLTRGACLLSLTKKKYKKFKFIKDLTQFPES